MKKFLALLLTGAMVALTACGSADTTSSETTDAAETTEAADETETAETAEADTAAADGKTFTVGICQLVQHEALDAATQGFKDALTEEFGDSVTFDEQNAQGDSNTCSTIINNFVAEDVDLILANATPAA